MKKKKQTRNIKYQGLSLPVPVINRVKKHIAEYENYTSVTDFVRQAITEKIQGTGLANVIREYEKLREAKQEQEEKWDRDLLEHQYKYSTPKSIKDTKKLMKQSYNKNKREIPTWLQDETEFEDMFAERIEKAVTKFLEKKDKRTIANGHGLD